jgi:RND family efflux transporter MFP subunit
MSILNSRFLLSLPFLAIVLLSGCAPRHETDPRTETQLVRVASVSTASGSDRAFTGVVTARVQSNLGFRVSGKVTERLVDTGQAVRVGQPLMRIDRTDFTHAITAQVESVAAARAHAEQTAADEARYRGLVSTGAASASTYDQMKAAADAAGNQLAAAEAQARVAKDEGEYTTLVADADGIVVETLAEPGQVVAAGQTVIRLAHAGPREAAVNLPETVERPKLGSVAQAALYSKPGVSFTGRLRQLSDAADPLTRTFEARYVLGGEASKAPLGETVTISLDGSKGISALEVPLASVFDPGSGPGVWILDRQKSSVTFRKVHLLQVGVETATIADGVKEGDHIVALAPHLLHEGQVVRVEEVKAGAR